MVLGRYFSPDIKKEIEGTGLNFSEYIPKSLNVAGFIHRYCWFHKAI